MGRLFDNRNRTVLFVEFHDAEEGRVRDPIAEDGCAGRAACSYSQESAEAMAIEDVVPQHQAHPIGPDEAFTDEKRLRQSVRRGLNGVGEPDAEFGAAAQKALEIL